MRDCFFAAGSVRHRQKIMSAYWASVIQVFWPLTMYFVALALGLGLQRGEVGAGARLRKALAPPVVDIGDARQIMLLLGSRCRRCRSPDRPC